MKNNCIFFSKIAFLSLIIILSRKKNKGIINFKLKTNYEKLLKKTLLAI